MLTNVKYILVKKNIGDGFHGNVTLVREINSNKLYACKKFKKTSKYSREYFVRRLNSEYCILNNLDNENIVKLIEIIEYKNEWYAILEYCEFGSLFKICNNSILPVNLIEKYFIQLINGIFYLHSRGIAHKDIKLENLLIDSNDCLKISDFTTSELYKIELTKTRMLCSGFQGSPPYLAPELYENRYYDGEKADVWSCGIILFIFCFNFMPFSKAENTCFAYKHFIYNRKKSDSIIFRLPLGLRKLVLGMLEPDPSLRFCIEDIKNNSWFQEICKTKTNNIQTNKT
ncbi:hypothetical protein GVAV_000319 [Gurleya vavrai]